MLEKDSIRKLLHMTKMMNLPPTSKRVARRTNSNVNAEIRNKTIWRLNAYKELGNDRMSGRIRFLSREWDTERMLETNAASIILLCSLIGLISGKRCWALASGTVGAFMLTHALQGWCPPLPVIRKLGVRTAEEIHNEKMVLKLMRGDFRTALNNARNELEARQLLEMAEKD